jgi:micrococcal nuclease
MIRIYLFLVFVLQVPTTAFEGKVVRVVDGDTIDVLKDGKALRIRLNGIDCPEKKQAFGAKAKEFTSNLIFRKTVVVKEKEIDRYGRTIADIYLSDGTWVNKEVILKGFAWHYKRYSKDENLAAAEQTARRLKIGLWSDPSPLEPWNYRRPR